MEHIEWSKAQDLLLKLVQALAPLAERSPPISAILQQRFSIPQSLFSEEVPKRSIRQPVTLLTSLHSEVEKWIGEPALASPLQQPTLPIARQAQRLIDQVQDTIGKLCQSMHIKDPKEEPLREALKRLKPHLERIIEAVSHEGMHSSDEGNATPFRAPIPRSIREQQLKKLIAFPESKPIDARPEKRGEGTLQQTAAPIRQEAPPPQPTARTSLPAAPYTSETRTLTPGRKKKKRKGFWFRDNDEAKK